MCIPSQWVRLLRGDIKRGIEGRQHTRQPHLHRAALSADNGIYDASRTSGLRRGKRSHRVDTISISSKANLIDNGNALPTPKPPSECHQSETGYLQNDRHTHRHGIDDANRHGQRDPHAKEIEDDVPNAYDVRSDLATERIHTPDTMSSSRFELKLKEPRTCEWSRRITQPTLAWPFLAMLTKLTAGCHTIATKESVQIEADVPNAHEA